MVAHNFSRSIKKNICLFVKWLKTFDTLKIQFYIERNAFNLKFKEKKSIGMFTIASPYTKNDMYSFYYNGD